MLNKLILFFLFLSTNFVFGQSYTEKFNTLMKENDSFQIVGLLKEWEAKTSDDPEYYISAFNFYYSNCKQEEVFKNYKSDFSNQLNKASSNQI